MLLQFLTVWLPGHIGSAHFTHVRRFLAFFAGSRSAKESATRFQASFSMVSQVMTIADILVIGFEFEGRLCWEVTAWGDKVEGSSELMLVILCWPVYTTASELELLWDSSCSESTNPFSTTCGILDWKGIGGAATERSRSWMSLANGFRIPDDLESASFISKDFLHWA